LNHYLDNGVVVFDTLVLRKLKSCLLFTYTGFGIANLIYNLSSFNSVPILYQFWFLFHLMYLLMLLLVIYIVLSIIVV